MAVSKKMGLFKVFSILLLPLFCGAQDSETTQSFMIDEEKPNNSYVGTLGEGLDATFGPPYTLMPNGDSSGLKIDLTNGIITTASVLDRETKSEYNFIVMSVLNDKLIQADVQVRDINDNKPRFNVSSRIELSESANTGSSIHIGSAIDDDTGDNGIVSYAITSGNENGNFELKGKLSKPFLYLDLVIKKLLDFENISNYALVISVVDGGQKTGSVMIQIPILDANDNPPKFDLSRYSAQVREDQPVGKSVLKVSATDQDSMENARITYTMDYQKDPERHFNVEPTTGVIRVNKPLDYEKTPAFQLSVIASDNASEPLRDTTSVEIIVIDINEQPANVNLLFLSNETTAGHIPENTNVGTPVARISVSDPDNPNVYYSNITVTLQGADPYFGLETSNNVTFILYVKAGLDRESYPNFNITILAVDGGSPPLQATKFFTLWIDDINDHAPQFTQSIYEASVLEQAQEGSSVIQVQASDQDIGVNSQLTYGIKSHLNNSNWFEIDPSLGIVIVRARDTIDCEENPNPWIIITATDSGSPPRTGSATVKITVLDVNDMQPQFAHTYYQQIVPENVQVGSCILTVSADDPDCNGNTQLTYQLSNSSVQTDDKFSLGVSSGELCVKRSLDYETQHSYTFQVFAIDNGGLTGDTRVQITVTDINDNRPEFYPRNYSQNLDFIEATNPSKDIVTVVAHDIDSGNYGRVFYRIIAGSQGGAFTINAQSGLISLSASLPQEEKVYVVEVQAYDGGGLTSLHAATVHISVMGSGSPRPSFERATYSFSVPEKAAQSKLVGQVLATVTPNSGQAIHYSITSGDVDNHFYIDRLSGKIFTNNDRLDHEQTPNFLIIVMAETDSPPVFGKTQVNISVEDINDNAPQFYTQDVDIHVWEDEDMAEVLYKVIATDRDSGQNGTVRYSLVENRDSTFVIDQVGGEIRLQKSLDYEDIKSYTLVVGAHDMGVPPLSTNMTLNVHVTNKNDNPPTFLKTFYEVNVVENLSLSATFLEVQASDRDMDQISYSLQEVSNIFGIWPNNGHMYLKMPLDREVQHLYQLFVIAKDNGKPTQLSATATVRILVTDANDNNPEFSDNIYIFPVSEDIAARTVVGSVTATDQDIGDNAKLEYAFVDHQDHFIINTYNGEISTSVALDREAKSTYTITVTVRDFGVPSLSDTTMVKIVLLDINDNTPQFASGHMGTVMENKAKGTNVLQVHAVDPDNEENGTVSYFFNEQGSNAVSLTHFELDPKSGWITTAEVLDYEKSTEYHLVVVAMDYGTPQMSSSATITVSVLDDINEGDINEDKNLTIDLVENTPVGSIVGRIRLHQTDNSKVSYFIFAGNDFDLFSVNKTNGDIYCIRDIDYEVSSWHTIGVHAIDASLVFPQTSTIKVNINVLDENDNPPLFEKDPVMLKKPENQQIGQIVYIFSATDRDSGVNGSITYSIQKQEPEFDFFSLDAVSGALRIKSVIDYEQTKNIALLVRAEDNSPFATDRLHSTVVVLVSIEDENDNRPVFKSYSPLHVLENVPIGYAIVKLFAVDLDDNVDNSGNGVVSYKIVDGNDGSKFALDSHTGMLSVSHELDRESKESYTLNVSATDRGMPQHVTYLTLNIVVGNVNDNPPTFFSKSVYTVEISENNSQGDFLMALTATDSDQGDNQQITYMLPPGTAGGKFAIDSNTGALTVTAVLDREEQSSYEFTAFVFDNGNPMLYDTAKVIVKVTDVNDHAPVFQQSIIELRIPENIDLMAFYTVRAQDLDQGNNGEVSYSITDGNIGNHFSIDRVTGQLSCTYLDREDRPSYNLTIQAQDGGFQTTTMVIHIIVLDENDNAPTFIQDKYTKRMSEDVQIGTMVRLVSATDRDENGNGRITYSLGNDTDGMFKVDSVTGNITTTRHFDREKKSKYIFKLVAEDNSQYNRKSTTATVEVTIDNVNDNSPIFQNVPYIETVNDSASSNTFIVRVTAVDLDLDQINYSLSNTSGDRSLRYFRIEDNNGDIYTRQFTSEAKGYHYLHVIAKDLGSPSRTTTTVVQIKVGTDIHEHLQFTERTYYAQVAENSDPGTQVAKVTAQVMEGTAQGNTQYTFLEGNSDNIFSISGSGDITVINNEKLDYETYDKVQLLVSAKNGGLPAYTLVEVNIQDTNDNAPLFAQDPYYTFIREDVLIGTTVSQVIATDLDSTVNGMISYSILQPNDQDLVFVIDDSGHITTHLPLDFEIVQQYRLQIEAVDKGQSTLTGTCIVTINVVDINDQYPKFPPPRQENVTETTPVGSQIMKVTANDQDTFPPLLYDFDNNGNQDGRFAINKFTGEIILAKPVDHEGTNHYRVALKVTDGNKTATTVRDLYIMDVNDNSPMFVQSSYQASVKERTVANTLVLSVTASDYDSGLNGEIVYSIETDTDNGFTINPSTGAITTTREVQFDPDQQTMQLTVMAKDRGQPVHSTATFVHLLIEPVNNNAPRFSSSSSSINVMENSQIGTSIAQLIATDTDAYQTISYSIRSGNDNNAFYISHLSGEIFVNGKIDREVKAEYDLDIVAEDNVTPVMRGSILLHVTIEDVNDMEPQFGQTNYTVSSLLETYPPGTSFLQMLASDGDLGNHARLQYNIISGNDADIFEINSSTGELKIAASKSLDYERHTSHRLVVQATDCMDCSVDVPRLSGMTVVIVDVLDVNDHFPEFPVPFYYTVFNEEQAVKTQVFQAVATDGDAGKYGELSYSISDDRFFRIDPLTGWVYPKIVFNMENLPSNLNDVRGSFSFMVTVSDGRNASVGARVVIGDVDEFPPQFSKTDYDFTVKGNAGVGTEVGQVSTNDNDQGSAGILYYFLNRHNDFFDVNITSGMIYVKLGFNSNPGNRRRRDANHSRHKRSLNDADKTLIVEVKSAVANSRSKSTVVTIDVDESCPGCRIILEPVVETQGFGGTPMIIVIVFAVVLVILVIVVVVIFVRYKKKSKKPVAQVYDAADFNAFDFSPSSAQTGITYSEPPSYSRSNSNNVTSEISEHSHHSVSSGRGSVEAEDDEEICMINALQSDLNQSSGFRSKNMPDSGIQDDDTTSEPSVQNSKDYLARLGIDSSQIPTKNKNTSFSEESLPPFSEEDGGLDTVDDPLEIDYNRLGPVENDAGPGISVISGNHHSHPHDLGFHEPEHYAQPGSMSSVINSEEEYSGSYNWDYLLDWGPQYQPLAHVFSEIARLKDDTIQPKKRPIQTVPQTNSVSSLKPQVKMIPPPMITNAPPQAMSQPANSRSSQSSGGSSSYKPPRTLANSNNIKNNVSLPSNARSPITYDGGFNPPLTPSFTPSLLPLATGAPGTSSHNGHNIPSRHQMGVPAGHQLVISPPHECEQELRI
ncbi:protein dachsous-like [Mizuhopecten yessoensis]|uniref:Protein dachsous n=1 Tax=Mizuhopecten yessoensis TaxID=6573 RepID=A0A210PNI7_MIZYE|nr:protein dachsous-like [Mizuhopecten yessoensis]OWF38069.1 Protein dachsous [Mizuhopecten yessoensis]